MAFGFLKKLWAKLTSRGASPSQQGNGNGRGHHGRRGRHGSNRQQAGGQPQAKPQGRNQPQQQKKQQPNKGQPPPRPQQRQQPKPQQQAKGQPQQQKKQPNKGQQPNPPQQSAKPAAQTPAQQKPIQLKPPVPMKTPPDRPLPPPPLAETPPTEASEAVASTPAETPTAPEVAPVEAPAPEKPCRHQVYEVVPENRFELLCALLKKGLGARAVVFCGQRGTVEEVQRNLTMKDVKCGLLSGGVNEADRQTILEAFRAGELGLVVATDGFDGGILAADVDCVVNYDFPLEAADYVRRAGNVPQIISFADEDALFTIPDVEAALGETLKYTHLEADHPVFAAPSAEEAAPEEPEAPAEPPPPPLPKTGTPVFDAQGREGRVIFPEGLPARPLPSFETALDPKKKQDEMDAYLKPLAQTERFEEWSVDGSF